MSFSLVGKYQSYDRLPSPEKVAIAYDSDLRVIRNAVTQIENRGQVKVLLLLDELEQMLPNPSQQAGWTGYVDFFRYLRGISQQTGFVVSVITAANPAICEEPHLEGRDNPIFQFYQEMYLPPFERHECFEMVEKLGKGMGIMYTESSLEKIYQETGGHPFVTRELCSLLTTQLFPERPLIVDTVKVNGN